MTDHELGEALIRLGTLLRLGTHRGLGEVERIMAHAITTKPGDQDHISVHDVTSCEATNERNFLSHHPQRLERYPGVKIVLRLPGPPLPEPRSYKSDHHRLWMSARGEPWKEVLDLKEKEMRDMLDAMKGGL